MESSEHRRQKDYWQRAAEDAGYRTSQEVRTGAGMILDVAIDAHAERGIEVQHSDLQSRLVKSWTTRSFRAGWLSVWFLDSDRTPPWFHAECSAVVAYPAAWQMAAEHVVRLIMPGWPNGRKNVNVVIGRGIAGSGRACRRLPRAGPHGLGWNRRSHRSKREYVG